MTRALHLVHQFDAAMHAWLQRRLPPGSKVAQLPVDEPWAVPEGANVLLVTNGKLRSLPRTAPAWAAGLEWVHTWPTGVDEAPDWLFEVPHFTVSRGAASIAIAEYVLAAIFDFEKRLRDLRATRRVEWSGRNVGSLTSRSVGLFGVGEIGRSVAKLGNAFGMTVRAVRRRAEQTPGVELVSFEDLCALSEHLVLCAPLTDETRGIFDARAFALCRPGIHLINVARGALIVPDALRSALDGPVARATLDVGSRSRRQKVIGFTATRVSC